MTPWYLPVLGAGLGLVLVAWAVAAFYLDGADLARYDTDRGERFASHRPASPGLDDAMARLARAEPPAGLPEAQRLPLRRGLFDRLFSERVFAASFTPVAVDGVKGEWVLAPGADPQRRTLYLHGGGFVVGSPLSHRTITSRFSALTGGAVLALDYRLMPEHKRMAPVEDARLAYRWMLEHGPAGRAPAQAVFVAGDSAGANLTLSLLAWARDQGLRNADAAVVLSPPTDATFASPSIQANLDSDLMLGPVFRKIAHIPRAVVLWINWLQSGIRPCDPLVSPVYGDLSRLPPLLVQVSETEMLYDDARRYVNRAREAGSPARLQSWNHTLHVWHIFNPELPEAEEAYAEIGKFLADEAPQRKAAP
ncbi:acetyl-hydrolase Bah [Janthinobacterium sp. HH01]|uniref:alpha/beta hydrolase n=1 Tax=Janthinobacterium sp. HH01 TaxID=1198452 RepID=UPI0002AE9558|nr:alpha/beta hydrolase [Janthinobacterium sp. HH01]ELX09250.1 acetyl-hydrolase Bah [Janthinobacterium sp. HH01]